MRSGLSPSKITPMPKGSQISSAPSANLSSHCVSRVKRVLRQPKRQIANGYVKQPKLIIAQTILASKLVSQEDKSVFYVPIDVSSNALRE